MSDSFEFNRRVATGVLGLVLAGFVSCGGCCTFLVFESESPRATAGGTALVDEAIVNQTVVFELPETVGQPVFWLVGARIESPLDIAGRWVCVSEGQPSLSSESSRDLRSYHDGGHDFLHWQWLSMIKDGPVTCAMHFTAPDPLPEGSRIVVVDHITPGDWIGF